MRVREKGSCENISTMVLRRMRVKNIRGWQVTTLEIIKLIDADPKRAVETHKLIGAICHFCEPRT